MGILPFLYFPLILRWVHREVPAAAQQSRKLCLLAMEAFDMPSLPGTKCDGQDHHPHHEATHLTNVDACNQDHHHPHHEAPHLTNVDGDTLESVSRKILQ